MKYLFLLLTLLSPFAFAGEDDNTVKGIVPGDALGWEIEEAVMSLSLGQDSPVTLEIYSPGFDPDDYRAALDGREELGDESYGATPLVGEFVLENGDTIAEGRYEAQPHEWKTFFEGTLEKGAYTLRSRFTGLGKNAFIVRVSTPDPSVSSLRFAEGVELFDVRGGEWVQAFQAKLPREGVPARYALYDGDGAGELEAKVVMADGSERALPVSEDLAWQVWEFDEAGTYTVYLRQPEGAYQYSNTVATKTLYPEPVVAEVVDTAGDALDVPARITGYSERTVTLEVPSEYQLIEVQTDGTRGDGTQVGFGFEGGQVRYVLEQTAEAEPGAEPEVPQSEVQAAVTLTRDLDFEEVLPGEVVTVSLSVSHSSDDALPYTLSDAVPEWLTPLETPRFEGTLTAGERVTHTYQASVRFGAEATSEFRARLTSPIGDATASDTLTRRLILVEKRAQSATALEGQATSFTVRVTNPLGRTVNFELRESPQQGLFLEGEPVMDVTLEANESKSFEFTATPERTGALNNQASVFVNQTPAGFPANASLDVKPTLIPERTSRVTLPFSVEAKGRVVEEMETDGGTLLVRHRVPANAAYAFGSSRLGNAPTSDPLVRTTQEENSEVTYLYWELPYMTEGTLSYTLTHQESLGALAEPSLTLKFGKRELFLEGEVPFEEVQGAREVVPAERDGLIKEPFPGTIYRTTDAAKVVVEGPLSPEVEVLLNGAPVPDDALGKRVIDEQNGVQRLEYFGLPLEVGSTLIEARMGAARDQVEVFRAGNPVRLEVVPGALEADGVTPVTLEVRALDEFGVANGFGGVTVQTDLEPLQADAFPSEPGYQVLLEDGAATVRLEPVLTPRQANVSVRFNDLETQDSFYLGGTDEPLYVYQGSVSVHLAQGELSYSGVARGYVETPLGRGTLQGALDTGGDIAEQDDPSGRFPLTGSGNDAQGTLRSDDLVAVRYDDDTFSLGYYADSLGVPGLDGVASGTALQGEVRTDFAGGDLVGRAYASLLPTEQRSETIIPDGTRRYTLSAAPIRPNSETVTLRTGAQESALARLEDYTLNDVTGTLTLAKPLFPRDVSGAETRIEVTYAPAESPRETLSAGGGVRYSFGSWTLGAGIASVNGVQVGAYADYVGEGSSFTLNYRYDEDLRSQIGVSGTLTQGALDVGANISYTDALQGQARVSYTFSEGQRAVVEHSSASARNQTNALYELDVDAFTFGLGTGYLWEEQAFSAVARAGYSAGSADFTFTHTQPFGGVSPISDFSVSYQVSESLAADLGIIYTWGGAFVGTVALNQSFGQGNLSVSYQLPGADGSGNRARFGIDTPLPLSDVWSLDLSANLDQDFSDGNTLASAGAGVRYSKDDFVATASSEVSYDGAQDDPFKVTFRGGASGQLDPQQVLSFDATYQLIPEAEGEFTAAYALRSRHLTLLTYHTLTTGGDEGSDLEGEVAPTLHPSRGWQLRPGFAYRVPLWNDRKSTFLASLGGHYYLTDYAGVGGSVYHEWQPATSSSATAFSIEGSVRVIDELWLALGYTFEGFDGLSEDTKSGLSLGLELYGGGQ